MHDLKHKYMSPTFAHGNQVNNSKHTQQEQYMQKTILARSWQDYPTSWTQDVTPTDVGPPSPQSMPLALQDEVPHAKN